MADDGVSLFFFIPFFQLNIKLMLPNLDCYTDRIVFRFYFDNDCV